MIVSNVIGRLGQSPFEVKIGTKEKETRATFIVNEDFWRK